MNTAAQTRGGTLAGTVATGVGGTLASLASAPATGVGGTLAGTLTGALASAPALAWPGGPHAAAMVRFNLQPTHFMHASRWAALLPPGAAVPTDGDAAAHRHASALLLRQMGRGARLVTDWQRPEWPLAVLPALAWTRLLHRLGLVVVQRALRQTVRGEVLRALAAQVGEAEIAWARTQAPALAAPLEESLAVPADDWAQRLPQVAAGVLAHALAAAPVAMRARLMLRAPAAAPVRADLGATRAAWALARTLLDEMEPAWRSSFPASR